MRDVTLDSLRRQVGVVFEESFLFSDTVRANIAYGRPDATDDEVEAAARAAEAHEFILALPDGLRHRGRRARPHAVGRPAPAGGAGPGAPHRPPRPVLDDATSSIDAQTEEEIHATLRSLMEGRTTLLVAHRRSTLRLADRIVVVDGGRVADSGTHDELLGAVAAVPRALAGPGDGLRGVGSRPSNSGSESGAMAAGLAPRRSGEAKSTVDAWTPLTAETPVANGHGRPDRRASAPGGGGPAAAAA